MIALRDGDRSASQTRKHVYCDDTRRHTRLLHAKQTRTKRAIGLQYADGASAGTSLKTVIKAPRGCVITAYTTRWIICSSLCPGKHRESERREKILSIPWLQRGIKYVSNCRKFKTPAISRYILLYITTLYLYVKLHICL